MTAPIGRLVVDNYGVWLVTPYGQDAVSGPGVIVSHPHGVEFVLAARAHVDVETGRTIVEVGERDTGTYRRWVYAPDVLGAVCVDYLSCPTVGRLYVLRWPQREEAPHADAA